MKNPTPSLKDELQQLPLSSQVKTEAGLILDAIGRLARLHPGDVQQWACLHRLLVKALMNANGEHQHVARTEGQERPAFAWRGALRDLRGQCSSVDLQHKMAGWRIGEQ